MYKFELNKKDIIEGKTLYDILKQIYCFKNIEHKSLEDLIIFTRNNNNFTKDFKFAIETKNINLFKNIKIDDKIDITNIFF